MVSCTSLVPVGVSACVYLWLYLCVFGCTRICIFMAWGKCACPSLCLACAQSILDRTLNTIDY